MGIKKAKTKEVKRLTVAQLGVTVAPTASIERVYLPERTKQTQLIEGSAKEAAAKLLEKLRFEVRIL
jgi:electron transfer flavoprotein beta subunit